MHTPRIAAAAFALAALTACPDDASKPREAPVASPAPALDPNATPTPTITLSPVPVATTGATAAGK